MNLHLLETDLGQQSETVQVIKSLELGISAAAIEEIASYLDITINELMEYLHISLSTWNRRKKAGKLDFNLSDKVFQVSKLLEYAENVFGNSEKVSFWFKRPSIVFENLQPVELIGSLSGINLIKDELIRIEHGVYI
ncbi:MAG: antitoxin Xre/MbcA/ParS toxin-binding domain-containing protein [Spirochaetota bacterium]|nr:antitoxin Xre/MbcA/ParS toxin-binding domain-containing protein [Spirochaetota bacterium]